MKSKESATTMQPINPKLESGILSRLTFWWCLPLIKLGNERDLQVKDLYRATPEDESEKLRIILQTEWEKELKQGGKVNIGETSNNSKLGRALIRSFGLKYLLIGAVPLVIECIFKIGQPLFLSQFLHYFDPDSDMPVNHAYLYATAVFLGTALPSLVIHPYFLECLHIGMQARVAICSLIFKKCLRLNQNTLGETNVGQVANLMTNDAGIFETVTVIYPHYLIIGPLQAIITTWILYNYVVGSSCFAGMAVLILFAPLQGLLGRVFSGLWLKKADKTDERIRTTNEILTGIKVIKMYAWEKPFAKFLDSCRQMEINVIRKTGIHRAFNESLLFVLSKLIIFITLVVYVYLGNSLSPHRVFLVVTLLNNIRDGMTLFFPGAVGAISETMAAIRRIENFLMLEEDNTGSASLEPNERPPLSESRIRINNITAKWKEAKDTCNTLIDVSFSASPRQVIAIVGQVAAGKSSLMNVILGELSPASGSVEVKGKVAYASQEPWIFSGTIRQNILCGLEYDTQRYEKVIKATALERDFDLLSQGDETEVGERGASLSGGQKARVNLARCLYVDADIYLMDDPLSAVDTHVGRHIFDEVVNGFLKDKIRVLVTHQLQYLKEVDKICIINNGRMEAFGSYTELVNQGADLAQIKVINVQNEDKPKEDIMTNETTKEPVVNDYYASQESTLRQRRGEKSNNSEVSLNKDKEESDGHDKKLSFPDKTISPNPIATPKIKETQAKSSSRKVPFSVYWKYFRAGGGNLSLAILLTSCILTQILFSASDYWLNLWTNAEHSTNTTSKSNDTNWHQGNIELATGIYVYSFLIGSFLMFSIFRAVYFFVYCLSSSSNLHNQMAEAVIRAPLSFFESNPVGEILNRFTKDVGSMDSSIPDTFSAIVFTFLKIVGIIGILGLVNLWLLVPIIIIAVIYSKVRKMYLTAALSLRRLAATTRSPVFTHLSSTMNGLTTIRAHHRIPHFQSTFDHLQNIHTSAYYLCLTTSRWLAVTIDAIAVAYIGCVIYSCLVLNGNVTSGEVGLAISSAMALTGVIQFVIRGTVEIENQMISVERVVEFGQLAPEDALLEFKRKDSSDWPSEGEIHFDNVSLRYNNAEEPILKKVTFTIKPKEKIGIVGRTGAGKSSLITALFRLAEPEGKILIDGIDSKSIDLHELRSKISIIPQDPVLFSGSLRKNLDPTGEYDDNLLRKALNDAKFTNSIPDDGLKIDLNYTISGSGSNLSIGQKQLVCLARAILKRNRILVMDEATANIDQKTDSLIQQTISEQFYDCTVLTIAHRLDTIMDVDRVLVLDGGCLVEFDRPKNLLKNCHSLFYSLVQQSCNSKKL